MAIGIGYGKVILFGEHFVVYGIPAVALGISNRAIVEIRKAAEISYKTEVSGTIPEYTLKAIHLIHTALKIKDNFEIHLKGDLPTVGGLGSSAAFCVALVRAFADEYHISLTDTQVNEYAYEGEKAFHGNPSGIDNTVAVHGGAIKFTRNTGFEKLKIGAPLHLVVGITGVSSPTAKMVEQVKKFKEEDPGQFETLCDEAGDIVKRGEKAVATGDVTVIGELMNENHELLKALGVSIEKNDQIVSIARKNGALGAKLTGGGGGGCCIALAKDKTDAARIIEELKKAGFNAFYSPVG